MNVLINATSVRLGGGITVIRNLLPAMLAADNGRHRYTVVARTEIREWLDPGHERVRFLTSSLGGRSSLTRFLWEQVAVPLHAGFGPTDVLLSPANLAVAMSPVPQVMIFQNMAPFEPDVVSRMTRSKTRRLNVLRELGIASARQVQAVVFISEYARRAIGAQLRIGSDQSHRVYLGRDLAFSPSAIERAPEILTQLGVRQPYMLSVSQFYAYKNFIELVIGFSRARRFLPDNVPLYIAGAEHESDYVASVRQVIHREGLTERVHLLGHVPYDKLPALYAAASLFLFPSTCENFPNILVEAMASGVPTLASKLGSMPEIAGDGAAYFDPFNTEDIARQIGHYWNDESARDALRDRGIQRSQCYSWDETAHRMLNILESVQQ
jgi:glycosyltransferase involved in cell wall biosynthesis